MFFPSGELQGRQEGAERVSVPDVHPDAIQRAGDAGPGRHPRGHGDPRAGVQETPAESLHPQAQDPAQALQGEGEWLCFVDFICLLWLYI